MCVCVYEVVRMCIHILSKHQLESHLLVSEQLDTVGNRSFVLLILRLIIQTHNLLLYEIVELFITMRGFSKASAWMVKYKPSAKNKKTTQCSKSLHRGLHDKT